MAKFVSKESKLAPELVEIDSSLEALEPYLVEIGDQVIWFPGGSAENEEGWVCFVTETDGRGMAAISAIRKHSRELGTKVGVLHINHPLNDDPRRSRNGGFMHKAEYDRFIRDLRVKRLKAAREQERIHAENIQREEAARKAEEEKRLLAAGSN